MIITKDTRVKTRNGLDAVVLADDVPGGKALVGYIRFSSDGQVVAACWDRGGAFDPERGETCNDLIPVSPSDMTLHGIDAEDLADLIWEGIDNAIDIDTTSRDWANAAAANVLKHLGEPA